MKILLVHNRYRAAAPSGENVVVDQEQAALRARGHEVHVLEWHSEEIAGWPVLKRAALPARVLWSEEARREVARTLADLQPDVVHLHNTFPLVSPSVLHACRDAGIPVVATLHNYKLGCASGTFFRDGRVCHDCLGHSALPAVTHGCYRGSVAATVPVALSSRIHAGAWRTLVSAYVFISSAQRQLLSPLGLPPERSFVKHNFVPVATAVPAPATGSQVAYVGRLDEAKGARFLMRAWDAFRAARPDSALRLVVVGGGDLAEAVESWAAALPSVTVAGQVPREEVSRVLAGSRAVLVPSQWEETFGMVAVEAMAAGTAPVATAHGSFPELVTDGVDGRLFPPTDVPALVEILGDVDDHADRWASYGAAGAQTFSRRFSAEAGVDRLLEVYRFAVAHPVGRSPGRGGRSTVTGPESPLLPPPAAAGDAETSTQGMA